MVDFLEKHLPLRLKGLAFVYCDRKSTLLQVTEYFLGMIVRQIVQRRQTVPDIVNAPYRKHQRRRKPLKLTEYMDLLQSLTKEYSEFYIVVDALDECVAKRAD